MIPIGDELPSRRVPLVTLGLITVNALVFLWELLLGPDLDRFFMMWGAVPAFITNPARYPWASLTLLTSMFLHGGWIHLIGNMLYLWIFGDNVEDALGRLGYLLFYLVAGIAAGLAQVMVAPFSKVPGVGANGAIAGVLAVYLVLYPVAPVRVLVPRFYMTRIARPKRVRSQRCKNDLVPGFYMMRIARLPALLVLGFWFITQLFNGALSLGVATMATGGIAWFAHIGGFLAGLVVGLGARAFGARRTYRW